MYKIYFSLHDQYILYIESVSTDSIAFTEISPAVSSGVRVVWDNSLDHGKLMIK
jgi:hypothetical protein